MLVAICVCILCLCFDVYCELFARGPCQNVQGTDLQAMPRREGRGAADGADYAQNKTVRERFPQAGERRGMSSRRAAAWIERRLEISGEILGTSKQQILVAFVFSNPISFQTFGNF